jgi:hypothetical protein
MKNLTYRRKSLSLGRRLVCDLMRYASGDNAAAGERTMHLADVEAARLEVSPRPTWGAMMTKAFALAANRHPEMRQVYLGFPWAHLCQYESQVATIAVSRRVGDEDIVFLAPLIRPEEQSLSSLDAQIKRYKQAPVEDISPFRMALRVARMPRLVRRFLWWLSMNIPGSRVRRFGTFMISTVGPFGAKALTMPTFGNPLVHYGALSESGEMPVALVIDHRIMDGAVAGYTLMEMEQALHHEIRNELLSMAQAKQAA